MHVQFLGLSVYLFFFKCHRGIVFCHITLIFYVGIILFFWRIHHKLTFKIDFSSNLQILRAINSGTRSPRAACSPCWPRTPPCSRTTTTATMSLAIAIGNVFGVERDFHLLDPVDRDLFPGIEQFQPFIILLNAVHYFSFTCCRFMFLTVLTARGSAERLGVPGDAMNCPCG